MGKIDKKFLASVSFQILLNNIIPACLREFEKEFWDQYLQFCKKNCILVRIGEKISTLRYPQVEPYKMAVELEKNRIFDTIKIMAEITGFCNKSNIPHVFPKAFIHYPDMGHDVDLWVDSKHVSIIDNKIRDYFHLQNDCNSLLNFAAGKRAYKLISNSREVELEIHHGRTGIVGEFDLLCSNIINSRTSKAISKYNFFVPGLEQSIIIQAVQRFLSHRCIRITDCLWTHEIHNNPHFRSENAFALASKFGVKYCYLKYIEMCRYIIKHFCDKKSIEKINRPEDKIKWESMVLIIQSDKIIRCYFEKTFHDLKKCNIRTLLLYLMIPILYYVNKWMYGGRRLLY